MVDNIEISVAAKISVDGDEYDLEKVQKQKWVKKRGTNTREFQGNVNEFEINGYPKSQKEFKEFISEIVDEDVFNLITNPNAFNALAWKKQREILMKFVGSFSDVDIAEGFGEKYTKLIPELKIASTDDILKKYTKAKTVLNKDMVEIPARIDEISKQLVIADVGALEVEKTAKEVALQKVEDELSGGNSQLEDINSKRQDIMNLKFSISEIQNEENQKLFDKSKALRDDLVAKEDTLRSIKREIADTNSEIHSVHSKYEWSVKEVKRLQKEWRAEKAKTFTEMVPMEPIPESASVCPACGQDLPEDVIQKNIENYEKKNRHMKINMRMILSSSKSGREIKSLKSKLPEQKLLRIGISIRAVKRNFAKAWPNWILSWWKLRKHMILYRKNLIVIQRQRIFLKTLIIRQL